MTDPAVTSLVNSLNLLSVELTAGLAVAATVALLRLAGKDIFTLWNVTFDLRYAWFVFVLFTVAHLYLAGLVTDDADTVAGKSQEVQQDAWSQISGGGYFLLHGMHGRTAWIDSKFLFVHFRKLHIEISDQTAILHYGCGLLLFCACVNWARYDYASNARVARKLLSMFLQTQPTLLIGLFIVFTNWNIATHWVYAVSQLAPSD